MEANNFSKGGSWVFFFFFGQREEKGTDSVDKGCRTRSKVDHSDLIVVVFGSFRGSI